jgi:fibro-slime domain-containing protein
MLISAGLVSLVSVREAAADDPPAPDTIELAGIIRDFKEWTVPGGHPDFEHMPQNGFGRYSGNVDTTLGVDGKPVFTGDGAKVAREWRDAEHRQISYSVYDPDLGDIEGHFAAPSTGGINSAGSFAQWYRDMPGVCLSAPLTITLVRQPDGLYVFDDKADPDYSDLGGFFPIDGQLFGNSGGQPDHNFHFTYELHAEFTYDADGDQHFKFVGDDDVWVFIDGRLVIDLGGVHAAHDQYVDLSRLGLDDGETYTLDFFFAQRHRPQSNFRIETNIFLEGLPIPSVLVMCD